MSFYLQNLIRMATTRKSAMKAGRATRSIAAANAVKSSGVPSSHIRPAPFASKKAVSANRHIAKKKVTSTGTKKMTTRSMARPNAPRVIWSKDGQKIEVASIISGPTPRSSPKNKPATKERPKKSSTSTLQAPDQHR
jgi:hypothetical protein